MMSSGSQSDIGSGRENVLLGFLFTVGRARLKRAIQALKVDNEGEQFIEKQRRGRRSRC